MRTYSAELTRWRSAPLCEPYRKVAFDHAATFLRPGPRRHAFEIMCPYCGHEGLSGTVRLGSKGPPVDVELTRVGFEVACSDGGTPELMKAECINPSCRAVVDPIAYYSPAVFYGEKENTCIIPEP